MPTTLVVPTVAQIILASNLVAAGLAYALPVKSCKYSLQIDLSAAQTFTSLVQLSNDGVTWGTLLTITQADVTTTALFQLANFSAKFIRINTTINATPITITATLLAKPLAA